MSERTIEYAGGTLRLIHVAPFATIELNVPRRRNAISLAMWRALPEIAAAIEADEGIRVVIMRGQGGAFSAGADISEFAVVYSDAASTNAYNAAVSAGQGALRDLARPTLALIDGPCFGGGCALALSCDLRFASTAARFAITPAKLGLAYSFADTAQLVEKIGPARAKDMLFSGRALDAAEAQSIGLIDRLCAPETIEAEVHAYAETIAGLSQASQRAAKVMINAISEVTVAAAPDFAAMFERSFSSEDFREGYRAFLEKRAPRFLRE